MQNGMHRIMNKFILAIFTFAVAVVVEVNGQNNVADTAIIKQWLDKAYSFSEVNADSFLYYIRKAENKSKDIRCYTSLAKCYLFYASHYRRREDFKRALIYAHASVKLNLLLNDYHNLAASYFEIGENYLLNIGNYDSAIVYYNKSYRIYENHSDSLGIASTHFSIMNAYYLSKEYKHAYEAGLKLLNNETVKSRKNFYSNVLTTVGAALSDMGKKKESLKYLYEAANLYEQLNQKIKWSRVLNNIANAYKDLKMYDSSEFFMKQSLELKRQSNNPKSLCITLGNYADLLILKQRFHQARWYAEEMYKLSQLHKLDDQFMYANWYLSRIEQKQHNYKKALEYLTVYHQYNDSLNKIENERTINSLVAQLDLSVRDLSLQKLKKEKQASEAMLSKKETELKSKQMLLYIYIIMFFVVLILAGFGYFYIRNKNMHTRSLLEKELLTYKIEAMSLQINPHFIFNILNSIQWNIKNNDYELTSKYIALFSRLLRVVFDNSQQHSVSFLAEIESLKLYVELEQLRLKNKFRFSINKLNQFNPIRYKIPPLLLQPFVENAIWHGFFGDETSNTEWAIEINIKEKNNTLFCELIDNGIGFTDRQKDNDKISRGIGITQKRIEIYNQLNKTNIRMYIQPLTDHPVFKSGTKVLFEFPATE